MKKLWKKLLAITTAVMMVIMIASGSGKADIASGKGTVEIIKNGETESEYLSDAKFSFYKIASITNTEGKDWKYTVESDYKKVLDDDGTAKNLNNLPSSVWESKIDDLADITNVVATATSAPSNKDNNGSTGKTELPLGVYLVKRNRNSRELCGK